MNDKTRAVFETFENINAIPRQSRKEGEIRDWLARWAADAGFEYRTDKAGNLIIDVAAAAGMESAPTIVLQGHMDMVCEKRPEVEHDFSKDPIHHVYDGDWLRADGTTLGADNGIALALAMRVAADPDVAHPPLELLFTVDEETGLTGALELEENSLKGRILLNLDSEEDDTLTVGCAGGRNTTIRLPLGRERLTEGSTVLEIEVGGLSGGHSGVDIRRNLGNANVILARTLREVEKTADVRLNAVNGGTAHNAIPRDAVATIAVPEEQAPAVSDCLRTFERTVQAEQRLEDPHLYIKAGSEEPDAASEGGVLGAADTSRVIALLLALPHGVFRMSDDIEGLVETSANLATVELGAEELSLLISERSSVPSQLDAESEKIEAAARLAGATSSHDSEYPAWTPNMDSELLARTRRVFTEVTGTEPKVEAIHAGLEAGVIGAKHEGMDMVSLGPTIEGAHSPDERLYIPSIDRVRRILTALLESFV
ncbi:MAG: beta-Ala-His dipeptidase [Spirochaetes bacterium]|jgi:dipeptidase D|nr:beta-Ala-His dipeptidase [Spirochaetota bacterium]